MHTQCACPATLIVKAILIEVSISLPDEGLHSSNVAINIIDEDNVIIRIGPAISVKS